MHSPFSDYWLVQFDFGQSIEEDWTTCGFDIRWFVKRKAGGKVWYLSMWIVQRDQAIYNTLLQFSNENTKKYEITLWHILGYLQLQVNQIFAWYKFNDEGQGSNIFSQFVTNLKLLAKDCNFTDNNKFIRDKVVFKTFREN